MINPKKIKIIKQTVRTIFKTSKGQPYEMTDGQAELFLSIIDPKIKWLWCSAPTRYGKSDILAMAILYLASYKKLKVPIVGGSEDKAKKIMEYVVAHLADDASLYAGLINIQDAHDVDKLKVTVSKDALRWRDGGWIYITSVDSRRVGASQGEKVVGEGGDVIVLEEAGLITNKEQFSKVVRMPEEDKGWGKLIMSGNCIEKSVFETAYNDPLYHKVRIDLDQAIKEGRYTQEYLEQKKGQTTSKDWKRYYLVLFPAANEFTIFKPKKYEILPNELKYYGAVDLALGEAKKGSLVGITILGVDGKGQVYEIDSIGVQIQPEETMRTIFNFPYKFQRFGVEKVQFQAYFLKVIEEKSKTEGKYIPFQGITQNKKKEERIESLEPFINTGQILFKGDNELWDEMQSYPTSDHLDVLDSLEMAWRIIGIGKFEFVMI
jgi:predicted phage terminase large subunit-like protein